MSINVPFIIVIIPYQASLVVVRSPNQVQAFLWSASTVAIQVSRPHVSDNKIHQEAKEAISVLSL